MIWELVERDDYRRGSKSGYKGSMRGYRGEEHEDSYKCGYEDGYRDAMHEARKYYDRERSDTYDSRR